MAKLNCGKMEGFMAEFGRLEQKITELHGEKNRLEARLEDSRRLLSFHLSRGESLMDEKQSLLVSVEQLQQTLQEQCHLTEEKDRLRTQAVNLKLESERAAEAAKADVQQLLSQMAAAAERHQRALEDLKRGCSRAVQEARLEAQRQMEAKEAEARRLLEEKQEELEEANRRLKEQERERHSELLKLQMEFGAKLARVQSSAQRSQQQLPGSGLLPQSVFKRKLQSFQEEKNKETAALRQRIRELEEKQRALSHVKRRRLEPAGAASSWSSVIAPQVSSCPHV